LLGKTPNLPTPLKEPAPQQPTEDDTDAVKIRISNDVRVTIATLLGYSAPRRTRR
jgi:hypothetical protein